MEVKRIENFDNIEYLELINSSGYVFNFPEWMQLHIPSIQLFGVYDGDVLRAAFYLYVQKKGPFPFYRTPPFTPHIGLILDVRSISQVKMITESKSILSAIATFLGQKKHSLISLPLPPEITDTQPFWNNRFKSMVHYTYRMNLSISDDDIEHRLSSKYKNHLNKSISDGLTWDFVSDTEVITNLILKTFERKKEKIDATFIRNCLNNFNNENNRFAIVCKSNDTPISVSFCVFTKRVCYYLYSGYDPEHKHRGAGVMCMKQSLLHAKSLGCSIFDFEGSMLPEVEIFLREFGGDLTPYYKVTKTWWPLELMMRIKGDKWYF